VGNKPHGLATVFGGQALIIFGLQPTWASIVGKTTAARMSRRDHVRLKEDQEGSARQNSKETLPWLLLVRELRWDARGLV
jgi:hypothetical protein